MIKNYTAEFFFAIMETSCETTSYVRSLDLEWLFASEYI